MTRVNHERSAMECREIARSLDVPAGVRIRSSQRRIWRDMSVNHSRCSLVRRLLLAFVLSCCAAGVASGQSLDEAARLIGAAESKSSGRVFEIEAKITSTDSGQECSRHMRVLYDVPPSRRYRIEVISEISPWPNNPDGSGLWERSATYAFDGKVYRTLHHGGGSPGKLAYFPEGVIENADNSASSIYIWTTGWSFSLPGVFHGRGMPFTEFIGRCSQAQSWPMSLAHARVAGTSGDLMTLSLTEDSRGETVEVTIDRFRGCAIVKLIQQFGGGARFETTVSELAEISPGVFYPKRATVRVINEAGGQDTQSNFELVSAKMLDASAASDDQFVINWPVGTRFTIRETDAAGKVVQQRVDPGLGGVPRFETVLKLLFASAVVAGGVFAYVLFTRRGRAV